MKAFDRFALCHYAAVGECLEFGMAQANAALAAKNPTELFAKEAELGNKFVEKMTARSKEMVQLLTDAQVKLAEMASESAGHAAAQAKTATTAKNTTTGTKSTTTATTTTTASPTETAPGQEPPAA